MIQNEERPIIGRMQSRRETLRRGIALGTGVVLGASVYHVTRADGSPAASPAPESGYARPNALVDTDWLRDHLTEASLVMVGIMPNNEFQAAHIPGSVQIDWPELEVVDTSDESIERWQGDVAQRLGDIGITRQSTVVAYDAGTLFAARLWWILQYLGHENVHVLNGGLAAWREGGNDVASGGVDTIMSATEPYPGTPHGTSVAQMNEVLASLDDPDVVIVDARTPDEYADGHIPGAVNLNFPLNAGPQPPKFWKSASELHALYDAKGITPNKLVIPYCSTGVRSSVTAFTLHLIGYDSVALYTGSWKEWSKNPDAPTTRGDQP